MESRHGKKPPNPLALALMGAGLLILGAVAWLLLPQGNVPSQSEEQISSAIPQWMDFPAPELSLNDVKGNPASLADWSGSVILVNNWAIWCPPCKAEMPTLEAYYRKHKDQGFTLLAIESGSAAADVEAFVNEYRLTFPVWLDPDETALETFQNWSLPSSYVIDRQGNVQLAWVGAISREMLEKYVTPLLEP